MSNIEILVTNHEPGAQDIPSEKLRVAKDGLEGTLRVFTGQQGEHIVSLIPSLNVTGYGPDENTAIESLKENLETFFDDLFELSEVEIHRELKKFGWQQEVFFKRRMIMPFIDESGVLQNFDFPEQVKTSILQAA